MWGSEEVIFTESSLFILTDFFFNVSFVKPLAFILCLTTLYLLLFHYIHIELKLNPFFFFCSIAVLFSTADFFIPEFFVCLLNAGFLLICRILRATVSATVHATSQWRTLKARGSETSLLRFSETAGVKNRGMFCMRTGCSVSSALWRWNITPFQSLRSAAALASDPRSRPH